MNKPPKPSTIINWTTLLLGVTIIVLSLTGQAEFGHGLGDLVYLFLLSVFVLIHLILNLMIARSSGKFQTFFVGVLFLIIYLFFTYKMTLGRGPESPW